MDDAEDMDRLWTSCGCSGLNLQQGAPIVGISPTKVCHLPIAVGKGRRLL